MNPHDLRTPDELPVPHFEHELWPILARAHAEQDEQYEHRVGAESSPSSLHEQRTRRPGRRMILAGVGSVAAAAVALAAIVATDDSGSGGGRPDTEVADTDAPDAPDAQPELSLAAQITAAQEEAQETSILHTTTDNQYNADDGTPIGDDQTWTDEQSGARRDLSYSSEGEPFYDSGLVTAPAVDDQGPPPIEDGADPSDPSLPRAPVRTVDYCFSEYSEIDMPAIPGHIEADRLGEWLEEGKLVEDGTEEFRGGEYIRLVQVPVELAPDPGRGDDGWLTPIDPETGEPAATTTTSSPPADPADLDPDTFEYVEHIYLVDADTFRPVYVIGYPGEAADYSDATYIATTEYLSRTPENLAKFVPPVPEGFTQVANLRGDGERYDACGW